ncbi:MAG: RNA methyltransferase [Bacteroidota bacterium]
MITRLHHISTLDLPELEPYKTLRRPIEHLEQGIFVAEGEKVVMRLLESPLTVRSILLSSDWFDLYQPLIERNAHSINVFVGEKKLLETIVGHMLHQSIMAVAQVPEQLYSESVMDAMSSQQLTVLVDGITNAENMGVIVRNCVCLGASALLVLPSSCDPYLRRSVRNSMGNIFQLPIVYIRNTVSEIERMKQAGMHFYAAHPHPKSIDIRTMKVSHPSCIVLGAEGHGLSPEVLELCDTFVSIPMKPGVDSLNVASASAVLLWEFRKRISDQQ